MQTVIAPAGAQLLIYPMKDCTIAAGFKNARYARAYGYTHYGVDFDSKRAINFDVIASGKGTVLGVEKNVNSIGGVIVIRYTKVYNPSTRTTQDIIARYYHNYTIKVRKGQKVKAYDVIGTVSGTHKWWNHVHMELDKDIKYPFYTPQVAEASSKLLIRKGATDSTLLNPIDVLVVDDNQEAKVHSLAIYVNAATDAPKYSASINPKQPAVVAQRLVLPICDAKITAGYKNIAYYRDYNFNHYGIDIVSSSGKNPVYAMGDGKVVASGWDGITAKTNGQYAGCGYVLVIIYNDVYNRETGKVQDLACTFMHLMTAPLVNVGDTVQKGMLIANYGATGRYVNGSHLHVQFDTDTEYPKYCYGSGTIHAILKNGIVDTTIDPLDVLYIGNNQTIVPGKYPEYFDMEKLGELRKEL